MQHEKSLKSPTTSMQANKHRIANSGGRLRCVPPHTRIEHAADGFGRRARWPYGRHTAHRHTYPHTRTHTQCEWRVSAHNDAMHTNGTQWGSSGAHIFVMGCMSVIFTAVANGRAIRANLRINIIHTDDSPVAGIKLKKTKLPPLRQWGFRTALTTNW